MAIQLFDEFALYLAQHGVTLTELSQKETFAITKRWTTRFAKRSVGLHETTGPKAVESWLTEEADDLLLLFMS